MPSLFELHLYVDGDFTSFGSPTDVACSVCTPSLDPLTGLGSLSLDISGTGSHTVGVMVDYEIDEPVNTFFNEVGETAGPPPAPGLSWEIDEPGFVFGDIFDNLSTGVLDNGTGTGSPDDVAMALLWDFSLSGAETATVSFLMQDIINPSVFSLVHRDVDSSPVIAFSSTLSVSGDPNPPNPVPEPPMLGLWLLGYCLLWRFQQVRETVN